MCAVEYTQIISVIRLCIYKLPLVACRERMDAESDCFHKLAPIEFSSNMSNSLSFGVTWKN